ncbi:MAG: AI-2E family transporter [Pseudohongiella sp.]|nr:AI-2E family transporter [Pseudohongiella sp.]MDO9519082.1 AI-2E family transporter [Pseudohongiella sp.]MDP2129087.1 AI-2E family transporter [Pseudohongiella sp.]
MRRDMEKLTFIWFLLALSVLFVWILLPFWSAIFWACVMSLLFKPVQRRLTTAFGNRASIAAVCTVLIGFVAVVMPVIGIAFGFVREGAQLYESIEAEQISPQAILDRIGNAVPFLPEIFSRLGIDVGSIRDYLSASATGLSQILSQQALNWGRGTLNFTIGLGLMLYLSFFLLRDGDTIVVWLRRAVPLSNERRQLLFEKFAEVTRATVKGNLVVAMVQGALGGLIFWALGIPAPLMWSVIMAFLSLVPAVGASLVWIPVAIYLYATGDAAKASILVAYGALVIGLADNVLRPILVGRDTKLPDYIVLFSTVGGLSIMGINGFVIGPLIAALFLSFWSIFIREFNN